jgi:hypothetical protein
LELLVIEDEEAYLDKLKKVVKRGANPRNYSAFLKADL